MSILLFFAVLFVLILVHEWGHFIVAKKTGMRVDEFGIGFPPKLFGIKRGETEYTFNALPIGGFVRIFGENGEEPFSPVESEANDRRSEAKAEAGEGGTKVILQNMSYQGSEISPVESEANDRRSEAKAEAGEGGTKVILQNMSYQGSEISPVESEANDRRSEAKAEAGEGRAQLAKTTKPDTRSFNSRPKWAQALVLIAGVVMNVLFAWVLFSVTFMVGIPTAVDETVAGPEAQLVVAGTLSDSPAAGIPVGAVVTSLSSAVTDNPQSLLNPTPSTFTGFVSSVASSELLITYEIDGISQETVVVPVQGLIAGNSERYAVGTSLVLVETKQESFFAAILSGGQATISGLQAIIVGLVTLIGQSFTGTADFTQIAGPVGIVGLVGDAAAFGLTALLTFTAIISLNLAVINLLPFPALDGGRLVFVAIETMTGKDIPPQWSGRINLVGFALLLLLMVLVTYNDIINLF